jgi:hypothetical protein
MTQHYLSGELSLLLEQLQATTNDDTATAEVAHLRREAETSPPTALSLVAARALELADGICWDSVADTDTTAFDHQATASADVWELPRTRPLLPSQTRAVHPRPNQMRA